MFQVANDPSLKKDLENYKKIFSGKIVIENVREKNPELFQGIVKLKKDPKSEKFGIKNMILKEMVLKNTDWVIGLVIFAGKECFFSKNMQKKISETDDIENLANLLNIGFFFQAILFALVI